MHRLPDPDDAQRLASLSFRQVESSPSARGLADQIYRRRTDRRTPSSSPVPKRAVKELTRIGAEHGAFVIAVNEKQDQTLVRDLRQLSVLLQHDDDMYLDELSRWTHSQGNDGVPDGSVLGQDQMRSRFSAATRFPPGVLRDQPPTDADPAPTWLVVATSDDRLSRLRAGEALSAVLLYATMHDLAVVPYTQAVEVDATRERLELRFLAGGRCLQLILRVAVPPSARPLVSMTRRRPVHEVLTIRESSGVASG